MACFVLCDVHGVLALDQRRRATGRARGFVLTKLEVHRARKAEEPKGLSEDTFQLSLTGRRLARLYALSKLGAAVPPAKRREAWDNLLNVDQALLAGWLPELGGHLPSRLF